MIDVDADIEPPGLSTDDEGDDPPRVAVLVSLIEDDGTARTGRLAIPADASDDDLAAALIASVRGAATMRSPGLAVAVERRLR